MPRRPKILGQQLLHAGLVSEARLEHALGPGRRPGERIGETLVRMGALTGEDVARALSQQLDLPYAERPLVADPEATRAVSAELVRGSRILPLTIDARTITAATADPLDLSAADNLRFQSGRRVRVAVASADAVTEGIETHYGIDFTELLEALPEELRRDQAYTASELERAAADTPVVRVVDHILKTSITDGASDVHIEETGAEVRVRVRIDGTLRPAVDLPGASRRAVLSRLKIMAGMDISIRRRAQDGRIQLEHEGRRLTLRVSTLPVNGGEKAVVRVLDGESAPKGLDGLGMGLSDLGALRALVSRHEGVILAAGPTGSGKSTTLFAALSEVDRESHNVVTLEDPIEYTLPGANQVQVDARAGLGFADALRAVLRQDPDVVMVGEIRDRETAEIAMAAAVTGHLVLSTIHTTDAPGAITRLLNMGVPPFLVAGGLAGVVAQRLVRKRCAVCRGSGCEECGDGRRGRTGVYQVLAVSDPLRDEISRNAPSGSLRRLAGETGMRSFAEDARRAVSSGLTTPGEARRFLVASAEGVPCRSCGARLPHDGVACPACGLRYRAACSCGRPLERTWRFCPWCVSETPLGAR